MVYFSIYVCRCLSLTLGGNRPDRKFLVITGASPVVAENEPGLTCFDTCHGTPAAKIGIINIASHFGTAPVSKFPGPVTRTPAILAVNKQEHALAGAVVWWYDHRLLPGARHKADSQQSGRYQDQEKDSAGATA